jgi:hypothetical protein
MIFLPQLKHSTEVNMNKNKYITLFYEQNFNIIRSVIFTLIYTKLQLIIGEKIVSPISSSS